MPDFRDICSRKRVPWAVSRSKWAYYRGFGEFRASEWLTDSAQLVRQMTGVFCLGGQTQIAKVLKHAIAEANSRKVNAVVFVGDCMEESVDELCRLAGELGILGVPTFIFQEGDEPIAMRAFKQIARLTGGAHCSFDSSSADQLRDLLSAVAVFAAGGRKALEKLQQACRTRGSAHRTTSEVIRSCLLGSFSVCASSPPCSWSRDGSSMPIPKPWRVPCAGQFSGWWGEGPCFWP